MKSSAMNKDLITRMQSQFDQLVQTHPEEIHLEFWFARDLQEPLGYARWENFLTAIQRALESCKTTGYDPEHHFRGVTKMVALGSGVQRTKGKTQTKKTQFYNLDAIIAAGFTSFSETRNLKIPRFRGSERA